MPPSSESSFPNTPADPRLGDAAAPVIAPPDEAPALVDLVELGVLQQMQDGFVDVTGLNIVIRNAVGQPLTALTDLQLRRQSDAMLAQLVAADEIIGDVNTAPIVIDSQTLGSITIESQSPQNTTSPNTSDKQADGVRDAASIQFLQLLAQGIARIGSAQRRLNMRVDELSALYKLSSALVKHDDLQDILDTAAHEAGSVLYIKAVSIRLLEENSDQFVLKAAYNLSDDYLNHSPIFRGDCDLFTRALTGEVVVVENLRANPMVHDPDAAEREGLSSMICAGLIYRDRGMGVIQFFTEAPHQFDRFEINLVKAMARLLASAIESQRLGRERQRRRQIQRQLHLAADVQKRLLPTATPNWSGLDVAARYVPTLELGGDFYDLIDLDGHLGVVIGDVVGKGVAAALLMASVRASLRAYAQDLYDIDEILVRVNDALVRDTRDSEFATLFYGVIDPNTLRLTYCNAGHDPPLLWRNGQVQRLDVGGMVVGVDSQAHYDRAILHLKPDDALLLYTDGLIDAMNFDNQRFGRQRVETAFTQAAQMADANAGLNHVLWECRRFTGLKTATDDTTMVVIKVLDANNQASSIRTQCGG